MYSASVICCFRLATILGKNECQKEWISEERQKVKLSIDLILIWAKKDRKIAFYRFDTNLGKEGQKTVSEREEKGALKTANLGRERTHARAHVAPHVSPRRSPTHQSTTLARDRHRRYAKPNAVHGTVPARGGPTRQQTVNTTDLMATHRPSVCESFTQELGQKWGKVYSLGKSEYN